MNEQLEKTRNQLKHTETRESSLLDVLRRPMSDADLSKNDWNGWCPAVYQQFLFIGHAEAAHNLDYLKHNRITHILNCADDVDNKFEDSFNYCRLEISDFGKGESICHSFPQALQFIQAARQQQEGRVFIHCYMGLNRSVTILLYLLMELEGWNLAQAVNHVLEMRPAVPCRPFEHNVRDLLKWELEKRGENSLDDKFKALTL